MIGKRFSWKTEKLQHLDDEVIMVVDNENKDWKGHILNIVDLLNEQQATINELQSIIYDYCCETVYSLYNEIKHLKEENEQLKEEMELLKQKEEALNKIWREYLKVQGVG